MGETGPCGPCSEIHYFRGEDLSKNVAELVNGPGDDTMEIWNLVFMQYDRSADGVLMPLPAPSVDTGAGLERIASIMQRVGSNYDIDLFEPVVRKIAAISGAEYTASFESETDTAFRVLCDHTRAASFLISDGIIPSNEGRGYVLRRIVRRAIRYGRKLPVPVLLSQLVDSLIESMGEAYPELEERRRVVLDTLSSEEERFEKTLSVGIERVGQLIDDVRSRGERTLGGAEVFRLYDTYGIPVDLIQELGEDEGVSIDRAGFEELMTAARAKAKASSKFQAADVAVYARIAESVPAPQFVGYDTYVDVPAEVRALVAGGEEVESIVEGGEGDVVVDPTPFYAESGGQVADTGTISWSGGEAAVIDTQKPVGELVVSRVRVTKGSLRRGDAVSASVARALRLDTTANHTATHLLHKALKVVLGETVQQAGSLVAPDRLRFDYSWNRPLEDDEVRRIEEMVNGEIRRNVEVSKRIVPIELARTEGAVAMFGEKYGEQVRVVTAGDFSKELCGGCHVDRTGDIGFFKIVSDRSLAAGVRRMEALTGRGALEFVQQLDAAAHSVQMEVNAPLKDLPAMLRTMQEKQKALEKEIRTLKMKLASGGGSTAAGTTDDGWIDVGGVKLFARRVDEISGGDLRNLADTFRSKIRSGVVLLGSATDGKATLLAAVTKDVVDRVSAHLLIQKLAPVVGGKGGGKPDLAQAGGKDVDRIDEALEQAPSVMRELMGA
jgi:alanyl-tRNA synthetase